MPKGIAKRSQQSPATSKSAKSRIAASLVIDTIGVVVMPCSRCESLGISCKMAKGRDKCAECTRRGRPCDGNGISLAAGEWFSGSLFFFFFC